MGKRSLEEYILTYTVKNADGEDVPLVTIEDYHKRFIQPLDVRFAQWDFYTSSKVLCWFKDHADKNPSMGTVRHKHWKGVKLYHCLGCGATGTVIRLHQRIQKEYYNRTLTDQESALEICKLYGIDASGYEQSETDQDIYYQQMKSVSELKNEYTIREYSDELLRARQSFAETGDINVLKRGLNSATVKMVALKNGWVDR